MAVLLFGFYASQKGMPPHPLEVYCRLDLDPNFGEEWLITLFTWRSLKKIYDSSR